MHRIGLKLWSTNFDCYHDEASRLYRQGVFDYVELYVVPGSLPALGAWEKEPYPFVIHAPHSAHGFNLAMRELRRDNLEKYAEVKQFADRLQTPYIIFHGGCDGSIEETARQLASFREPRALIENKPCVPIPSICAAKECRGSTPEELHQVMEYTGCGFCLDFVHAVCAANFLHREPYEYVEELMKFEPAMFHLSDLDSIHAVQDSHIHLGAGELPVERIIAGLPYSSRVTLETVKSVPGELRDFREDCNFFRRFEFVLNPASPEDCRVVFELANDELVRANSFQSGKIDWKTHCRWYAERLGEVGGRFYIVRNTVGEFVGQIRFQPERSADEAIVSFSLSAPFRGRSCGSVILAASCRRFRSEFPGESIVAKIKKENAASLVCFQRAGFRVVAQERDFFRLYYDAE